MGGSNCCVFSCGNTYINSKCAFYRFPTRASRLSQRRKWISAVKKHNPDGSTWSPRKSDKICSSHFINNSKSDIETSASYIPVIFPKINKLKQLNECALDHLSTDETNTPSGNPLAQEVVFETSEINIGQPMDVTLVETVMDPDLCESIPSCESVATTECEQSDPISVGKKDACCQVDFYCSAIRAPSTTFICNSTTFSNGLSDVQTQTEIVEPRLIKIPNHLKYKNKECQTPTRSTEDKAVGPTICSSDEMTSCTKNKYFAGLEAISSDRQLLDVTGVNFESFNFLMKRTTKKQNGSKISQENRLLIFLLKMKLGIPFSAISVIFGVHRTSVSRIFYEVLEELADKTVDLVHWPRKDVVQGTMPDCFKPDYSNTRVIIDCTEFKIQVPSNIDHRVYAYSNYKKSFTVKLLVGIIPCGYISFISKVAGGRKSDTQITIESGLLDLLEDDDVVLADKGFPHIQPTLDDKGKKVTIVMPPFLEKKVEFSTAECKETYNIAKVRIHVERIMQRLRTYRILDKVPLSLFDCLDQIIHVACVLVNLQPPIIKEKDGIDDNDEG